MIEAKLDEVVHQKTRLGILVILAEVPKAEFNYLKERLNVTAGNLSSHVSLLRRAGYVSVEKVFVRNRPKTWVKLTAEGRLALGTEIETLKALVERTSASLKRKALVHRKTP